MKGMFWKGLLMTGGALALISGSAFAFPESTIKTYYENDVTPPWGRIVITGATEVSNVNYVDRQQVEVQIYAADDMCKDNEIQYYLSTSEISDTTKITDWKDYSTGLKVNVTLPSTTSTNKISIVFKDLNGNTSLIYKGGQTVTYDPNASDATLTTGLASVRNYGAPFVVTSQSPKRDGYFFKGWGLTASDTTPSYYAGDVIPADVSIGTDSEVTLYAIWTTNNGELPKLADVAKIGDYVNYPVYYDNVGGNKYKGWRVISKDVDIDGNEAIGTVNLVSAGLPLSYYHYYSSKDSVENLAIQFLTTSFHESNGDTYRKTGFNPYQTLIQIFTNKYTATYEKDTSVTYPTYSTYTATGTKVAGTLKVRAMTVQDVKLSTGLSFIPVGTSFMDAKYQQLYYINSSYSFASGAGSDTLWMIHAGSLERTGSGGEIYVRPVVSLKPDVKTNGTDMIGAWNIEI